MCTSKTKLTSGAGDTNQPVAKINGRPVLQPTCNRVPTFERLNSLKKTPPKSSPPPPSTSPRLPAVKRASDLNSSCEKIAVVTPPRTIKKLERKKSKSFKEITNYSDNSCFSTPSYSSSLIVDSPGSFAAVRREQVALQSAQRKMKIAHYGRSKSAKFEPNYAVLSSNYGVVDDIPIKSHREEDKIRCSFITPNSDPIYVTYHDEEWGVPVHDDKMLFELLILSGAQVGSDWTSILKKRQDFRNAFSDFDAEIVANITEKQMVSISTEYGIEISRVRCVADNSKRILEIKKEFGSFEKYIWGFVNNKPISTLYKFGHKIPVKTSKSESISKDMVRRGFRLVGPTMVHSFMQAAGLTNDHLITCHRHLPCTLMLQKTVEG
ncbi:DNA glycosylase superfamily protein [Euphorbia peplus]|nr:DNA glycosylase superfamily protein [Euphorbia peplus]